jgi:phosphatidylserine/phosphatidylglycerophosphate/cardiolipin synthase-like enzyme
MRKYNFVVALILCLASGWSAHAFCRDTHSLPAVGTLQVAFTPRDDAGAMIADAIDAARHEIYVQAFSFTHRRIADALIAARKRRVRVELIADAEQSRIINTSLIDYLAKAGVPVYLDGEHASAHNKVIVIDPRNREAILITGSFNFTHAGQYRNAENVLLSKGNPALAELYLKNWREHRAHAQPYHRQGMQQ